MTLATVSYTAKYIIDERDNGNADSIEKALAKTDFLKVVETFPSGNRVCVETELSIHDIRKRLGNNFVADESKIDIQLGVPSDRTTLLMSSKP